MRGLWSLLWLVVAGSCAGDGCDCLGEISSFPMEARQTDTVQARVTASGFAAIADNFATVERALFPDGLTFDVPPSCYYPTVCCGLPLGTCQMAFDLEPRWWDSPRFEVETIGDNRLGVLLRPRVRTTSAMPVTDQGPLGGTVNCWLSVNSTWSGDPSMSIYTELELVNDPTTGELRIEVDDTWVWGLSANDISIDGGFLCGFGSKSEAAGRIMSSFRQQIPSAIEGFLCKSCAADSDCGPFAGCSNSGMCELDGANRCEQSFSTAGRLDAAETLGPLVDSSPARALDLYFAAGGIASSNNDGLSLGVRTGAVPVTDVDSHHCVPVLPAPAEPSVGSAQSLQDDINPTTGAPFDIGVAIHTAFLDRLGWAAHQSGMLCLNVGAEQVPLLTSSALSIVAPSMIDLMHGVDAPLFLLVRPQTAPTFSLGAGTFTDTDSGEREVDDPLVTIELTELHIDLYAYVDFRYVRLLTLAADARFELGLDVDGDGNILPVLGDLADALSNVRVLHSELLAETPTEIAARFPALLSVALPRLADGLADTIAPPAIAGFDIELDAGALTSIDDGEFLAIFANLVGADEMQRPATLTTTASVVKVAETVIDLELATNGSVRGAVEYSIRIDRGFWSPFTTASHVALERQAFRLPGRHSIEVRARLVGSPRTLDPSPVLVEVDVDKPAAPLVGFHGQQQSGGCGCSVGDRGSAVGGVLLALLVLGLVIGRPRKTSLAYFAMMALGLALAAGCGSPSDDIDPDDPTVVHPGPTGRWASMATDGQRVVMSAYEQTYGDLVFVDVRQAGQPRFTVIDGAPAAPIVLDPTGYRGGVNEPGANVGAWTSIVVAEGQAWIAYQDLDNHSLRFAAERDGAFITSDVLAAQDSGEVGLFASLVVTPDGRPAIAHLSYSVVTEASEDDAGEPILAVVRTELSWTEALTSAPMSPNDWITTVIESTEAADTLSGNLPAGVGLFASAAITPTGPVVAYYDETAGTLRLARASADGWATELIDGNLDRGQWADLLAINEELYIAYQDASSDSLRVAHIDASGAVTTELVDDGVRGDERRHSVGGSARLVSLGGEIGIAYQDGTTSDLMWAQRANGSWKIEPAMQGPIGYGFFVGAVRAGGEVWLSSFAYDQTMYPPGHTEVTRLSR